MVFLWIDGPQGNCSTNREKSGTFAAILENDRELRPALKDITIDMENDSEDEHEDGGNHLFPLMAKRKTLSHIMDEAMNEGDNPR
jgi:hypothetical protein